MSKASIDTSLTETLIIAAPSLEIAQKIRLELQHGFSHCWFFVYQDSQVFATNEWGGKLNIKIVEALQDAAYKSLDKLTTSKSVEKVSKIVSSATH